MISREILKYIVNDRSARSLIFANIVVIVIAVAEQWDLTSVMFIYWCQNVIIGLFNILKILSFKMIPAADAKLNSTPVNMTGGRMFLAVFFAIHYGFFHYGYYEFIRPSFKDIDMRFIIFSVAIFFVNHLFSFIYNFKADDEKADAAKFAKLMFFPYARIVPMHLTIIFGCFLAILLRNALAETIMLIFFLILKTGVDVRMHLAEHGIMDFNYERIGKSI